MFSTRNSGPAAWAAAAVLVLGPLAAACGDDGDGGSGPATSPPTTAATPESPTDGAEPADPAAAEQQIKKNWTAFFDPAVPADEKVKLLENGEALRPVLMAFAKDKNAARASAEVTGVQFTSATRATVTYNLMVDGNTALPDAKGTAVLEGDTWKVSQKALCALVELSPNAGAVPGC
ncbi:hypothetical protein [Streptomyces kurssanovii]|uniref:Low molecular weight antigen MTB12-like C-terminal domain-containing protein n=1 Tax=Streptomyces kurssanovii TaxID=67312 RepID=A0ABV3I2G2_9ACTN